MISRALSALGLMKRSEHEARMDAYRDDWQALLDNVIEDRDAWEAKFKLAATDLAKQAEEIERLNREVDGKIGVIDSLYTRIDELRPDALLWRAARDKRAARKGSVS